MAGAKGRGLRGALVIAEVALALTLMVGAGLLLRSYGELLRVSPGFRADNVLTVRMSLPFTRYLYEEPQPIVDFYSRLVERVAAIPAVEAAGVTEMVPLGSSASVTAPYSYRTAEGELPWGQAVADYRVVSPGYFEVLGTDLVHGRFFGPADTSAAPNVVIVDERLAARAWPGTNPIGRQLKVEVFYEGITTAVWCEVVGVTEHVRNTGLRTLATEQVYLPHGQSPRRSMTLAISTRAGAIGTAAVVDAVRAEVAGLDAELPLFGIRPLQTYVDDNVAPTTRLLLLIACFAAIAVVLAAIGLYGTVSTYVSQATRELGVRSALGATAGNLSTHVLGHGLRLAGIGAVLGLGLAAMLSSGLRSSLFGVTPLDPLTYVEVAVATLMLTLVACAVPAWRAARLDPLQVLKSS